MYNHLGQHQCLQILIKCLPDVIEKYGMDKKMSYTNMIMILSIRLKVYSNDWLSKAIMLGNGYLSCLVLILLKISGPR
jgi:hypothetical protein